jgi:hypothetical protein
MEPMMPSEITSDRRPWVHHRNVENIENISALSPIMSTLRLYVLDGSKMQDLDGLYGQYYEVFDFPTYFGWNWPAFDECLSTLKNTPSSCYLTIIHSAELILIDEPQELQTFIRTLSNVGQSWGNSIGLGYPWGNGPVAFNTILLSSKQ